MAFLYGVLEGAGGYMTFDPRNSLTFMLGDDVLAGYVHVYFVVMPQKLESPQTGAKQTP